MSPSPDPIEQVGPLASLPSELLIHIIDNVDPASHLDLACTCRAIAHCSVDVLRRHRAARDQWHVTSDLQPSSVPTLLREAMRDPVVAWHVRSLEIWGPRSTWNAWRPFMLEPPDRFDPNARPLQWSFDDGERVEYLRLLRDMLHLSEDDIKRSHNGGSWAPGFQALRDVAIGVNSGTWLDQENDVHHSPYLLASILLLPKIDSVYFHGLYDEEHLADLSIDSARGPSPGSSSVRHLFIDGARSIENAYRENLIAAPRALKTLCIRGNGENDQWDDMDLLVTEARKFQNDSLESLMLYEAWGMHGYRCTVYRPDDVQLSKFKNLRHVCIDEQDLISEAWYDGHELWELWKTDREASIEFVISQFPVSMEVLLLGSGHSLCTFEMVEECFIRLVESGRYPNLKAIFIEDDMSRRRWFLRQGPQGTPRLQRLIAAGERHGVDINCTASGNRKRIHEIDFPPSAPDSPSLASAPNSWARGVEAREFNAFTGRWQPKGCGNCGNCSHCFQAYTPEVWKTRLGASSS
ncbi:hypothetical protein ColTof3_02668 [Colletotrichum tofieldiae]|nr:hypothetical protein ColTof3_02668 [Colletotrichum tofieldiae]